MENPCSSTFVALQNNPSLEGITQASQTNNAIHYSKHLSLQLQQNLYHEQTIALGEKVI